MLFNSFEYIFLFLPLALLIYFYLNRIRLTIASKSWLVLASLFFYCWWNVIYLPLILGSIIFNYALGTSMTRVRGDAKKLAFVFGALSNIALLGYFKYANFFIGNLNQFSGTEISLLKTALPLGISFFTFTQIAYLADAYRREVREYDLLNYSLFVTFFPHLLAGPIIPHKEMMPQFDRPRNKVLDYGNLSLGVYLFSIGLFKKVALADRFAAWANAGYASAELTMLDGWLTSLSYTFQLYFDFSGYTDMALGSALFFNIRLPANFNSPYKALDIQDFWRRWHITLSRFLRDYVYVPLGGNRLREPRVLSNLMVTFLIGGLWHGAAWTFVFWGGLHGAAICITRLWKRSCLRMPRALAWFLTFNFVNITWVFFRAGDWQEAFKVLKSMFGLSGVVLPESFSARLAGIKAYGISFSDKPSSLPDPKTALEMLLAVIFITLWFKNSDEMAARYTPDWKTALFIIVLLSYSLFNFSQVSEFLYFNF
jgi:D-alanyl-lipoteichoic acid acyltransferase DltB (MBOAT superfamily)